MGEEVSPFMEGTHGGKSERQCTPGAVPQDGGLRWEDTVQCQEFKPGEHAPVEV